MLERIDYVVRPEMRDQTAMDELPQDARSDFDQQYRRAVALEAGNDPLESEDAGCINARHGAHTQNERPRGSSDVREHAFELPSRA